MSSAALFGVLAACGSFGSEDGPSSPANVEGGADTATMVGVQDGSMGPDAPQVVDAGATTCAQRAKAALLCADFDDSPTPFVYVNGIATIIAPSTMLSVRGPGKTLPNALWTGEPLPGVMVTAEGSSVVTGVHVELDFNVDGDDAGGIGGALVRVGLSPNQCYVDVVASSTGLILQTHCGYGGADVYAYKLMPVGLLAPKMWFHLVLDVDYGGSTATTTINGGNDTTISLNPAAKPGGTPYVHIGQDLAGLSIGFDDILATTSN
jgi:hypothetical protein